MRVDYNKLTNLKNKTMRVDYKTRTLLSQEATDAQDVQFAVEEAKLQLNADILATKKSLEDAKKRAEIAKTTFPLDSEAIVSALLEVEDRERGLKALEELKVEFGFDKE